MAVTLLHGVSHLVCDGVDADWTEFSIASPHDALDGTLRGKVWGNRQAIAVAMNAAKTELTVQDLNETLRPGSLCGQEQFEFLIYSAPYGVISKAPAFVLI